MVPEPMRVCRSVLEECRSGTLRFGLAIFFLDKSKRWRKIWEFSETKLPNCQI